MSLYKRWKSILGIGVLYAVIFAGTAWAMPADVNGVESDALPNAAVVVVNHAAVGKYKGQDMDALLAGQIRDAAVASFAGRYAVPEPYEIDYLLKKAGISEIDVTAPSEVANALADLDPAYIVLVDLKPFAHKNRQAMFNMRVTTTGTLYVLVLDVANRTVLMEQEIKDTADKDNPTSYNQVIPLTMEKLLAQLRTVLEGALQRE